MRFLSTSPRTRLAHWWQIILLVMLQVLLFELVVHFLWSSTLFSSLYAGDLNLYFQIAQALMEGKQPYRDFSLEYPPLALVPFVLPLLATNAAAADLPAYIWSFYIQSILLIALVAFGIVQVLTPRQIERRTAALLLFAVLVALNAPLISSRYDLFPALLTLLALYSVQRGRPGLAGWWLGCGVVAKLYPVVLLPIFALYYICTGQWRATVRLVLGSAITILGIMLPFFLLAPDKIFTFLRYHQQRGLQVESLASGVLLLGHQVGWADVSITFNYGAHHLNSLFADIVVKWLPLAFVALFGVVLARSAMRFRYEYATVGAIDIMTLTQSCVAALLAFIVTNKVLSPQYLIWLLPFAPLLRARYTIVVCIICALTFLLFPFRYGDLLDLQTVPILLLNLRNMALAALLIGLLFERGQTYPSKEPLRTREAA